MRCRHPKGQGQLELAVMVFVGMSFAFSRKEACSVALCDFLGPLYIYLELLVGIG